MTADSLTKALSREKHEKCAARVGVTPLLRQWELFNEIVWRLFIFVFFEG